jgi:hypothetical protein
MTALSFLSVDQARVGDGFDPEARSPLARALADAPPSVGLADISLSVGKLDVRGGDPDAMRVDAAELVRVTARRALVLCDVVEVAWVRAELRGDGRVVTDLTGALAGIRAERPDAARVMRRLTDLDLDALPAVGAVARVRTVVLRDGQSAFRLFFPQEYGHYVAEVMLDAIAGVTG